MRIVIDQSPRIENWTKSSVIAFANGQEKAIILPATLKRECLDILHDRGATEGAAKWMILAAGIVVLIRYHLTQINSVVIDLEFDRRTMYQIREWLYGKLIYEWRQQKVSPRFILRDISFDSVGRKHRAHQLAYGLYTGRTKSRQDLRVKSREILSLFKDR